MVKRSLVSFLSRRASLSKRCPQIGVALVVMVPLVGMEGCPGNQTCEEQCSDEFFDNSYQCSCDSFGPYLRSQVQTEKRISSSVALATRGKARYSPKQQAAKRQSARGFLLSGRALQAELSSINGSCPFALSNVQQNIFVNGSNGIRALFVPSIGWVSGSVRRGQFVGNATTSSLISPCIVQTVVKLRPVGGSDTAKVHTSSITSCVNGYSCTLMTEGTAK